MMREITLKSYLMREVLVIFLPHEGIVAVTQRGWPEPVSGQCWVRGLWWLFKFHKAATLKASLLNDDMNVVYVTISL